MLYVCLFLGSNTVDLLEPFVIAYTLDTIAREGVNADNLNKIILLFTSFIILTIAFWAFHGPARVIENRNAFFARANYRQHLLEGTLSLPAAWHTDHHSGDTIDKIEKASRALFDFGSSTFEVIESILKLVTSFAVLLYFDVPSSIIVVAMVVLTIATVLKFDKRLESQYDQLNKNENEISAKVFDVISNVSTVIILRIEKLVSKSIVKKILQPLPLFMKNNKTIEVKWFIVSMCAGIMVFLVMCSYFYGHVRAGIPITIGAVFLLYNYTNRVSEIFYRFAYQYGNLVQNQARIRNVESIENDFEKIEKSQVPDAPSNWSTLDIKNLSFAYQSSSRLDLDKVSMSIKRGERIALIGHSGSGKTTFLKLLRGLYNPKRVDIVMDGQKLDHGLQAISSQMALIPQDPEIFSTTIKENITMGVSHTMDTIRKYTDMAAFTKVAERLPKKWDSSIVEKGVNLSGGEKQRLALARGLLACADKSIVLLDESTSSVDPKNEAIIYDNIFETFKDKSVLASIHRLHLLRSFDTIYFFEGGKIIGSGSFEQLLVSSAKFKDMWEKYQHSREKKTQ